MFVDEQHAIKFSHCPFIRAKRGGIFVKEAQQRNEEISSEKAMESNPCEATKSETTTSKSTHADDDIVNEEYIFDISCKVCFDSKSEIALIPCGHMICAKCLFCGEHPNCPFCRSLIDDLVKIFY